MTPKLSPPKISVLIGTYNRESTIRRSVLSVLEQTFTSLEVIVVDDGSTDSTIQVLRKINDVRLKVIKLEKNQGNSVALNTALEYARGFWVAIQDSDDEWLPHKLEQQLSVLEAINRSDSAKPIYGICGRDQRDSGSLAVFPRPSVDLDRGVELIDILVENIVSHPTLVVRRDKLIEIGGYDPILRRAQDREMLIRLLQNGRLIGINEVLIRKYVVDTNLTRTLAPDNLLYIIEKHEESYGKLSKEMLSRKLFLIANEYMLLGRKREAKRVLSRCIATYRTPWISANRALVNIPLLSTRVAIFPYRVTRKLGLAK